MSCKHCVHTVTSALSKLEGVINVKVDLATKTISLNFNSDLISLTELKKTITDEGYRVV
ncbi:MAG: cation transporter [Candidatus Bathyarchaeota archaeon]|nr:cation transporter [Candidatus Termitimicrobium sp.]MCL2431425.1 cation transporter [Candidatus Termitimicrobium sp.]